MTKRPSYQWYPGDWRKDAGVQSCSVAARGLWREMIDIAHECEPYGHLVVNGQPMTVEQIARLAGVAPGECKRLLAELERNGVPSRTPEGAIFCRRMVRDEDIRNRRAAGGEAGKEHGIKGAEHGIKGGRPTKGRGVSEPPSEPPPSSSSSTSVKEETDANASAKKGDHHGSTVRGTRLPADWQPDEQDREFARSLGLDPDAELAEFRDFWRGVPGARGVKVDWPGTFRNHCRRQHRLSAGGPGRREGRPRPASVAAAFGAVIARAEADERLRGGGLPADGGDPGSGAPATDGGRDGDDPTLWEVDGGEGSAEVLELNRLAGARWG